MEQVFLLVFPPLITILPSHHILSSPPPHLCEGSDHAASYPILGLKVASFISDPAFSRLQSEKFKFSAFNFSEYFYIDGRNATT
jgi:hypothetical protein